MKNDVVNTDRISDTFTDAEGETSPRLIVWMFVGIALCGFLGFAAWILFRAV